MMTAASLPIPARDRALAARVLVAGAAVAVLDGPFAVMLVGHMLVVGQPIALLVRDGRPRDR